MMNAANRENLDPSQKQLMMGKPVSGSFLDPSLEGRRLFAEFWGTMLTVVFSVGSSMVIATSKGMVSYGMAMTARGLIVICAIFFMGAVSGAHLNPAVTLAFAWRRNFPWSRVTGYIIAQILGAIAAVLFAQFIFGNVAHLGASHPGDGISPFKAFAMETFLTAGLVNTILGTASGSRNLDTNCAIAVGSYIILAGLWAYPVSGASMNPARSFAPDLVRGDFSTTWIYILGPLLGALIGVAFEWVLKGKPTASGCLAAQGQLETKEDNGS